MKILALLLIIAALIYIVGRINTHATARRAHRRPLPAAPRPQPRHHNPTNTPYLQSSGIHNVSDDGD